jgi:putative two-component system response regulator
MLLAILSRRGFEVTVAQDADTARKHLREETFDLALCDIVMPGESGLQLARHVIGEHSDTAAVMVTALDNATLAETTLAFGAHGYVVKPFRENDLLIAVANALAWRATERRAREERDLLEQRLMDQTEELREAVQELKRTARALRLTQDDTIRRLTRAIEFRSRETSSHMDRIGEYSLMLALKLALPPVEAERIGRASGMHDIGKVAVPDRILLKPGPLTPDEREQMQRHAQVGYDVLADSGSEMLELAATIALTHHEWWDGSGYPRGLADGDIPVAGRITAVADCFDALTHDRAYRPAYSQEEALEIMRAESGTHFEPAVVDALFASLDEAQAIAGRHAENGGVSNRD